MSDWEFEEREHQIVKEAFTKLNDEERGVIAKMISANMTEDRLAFLKKFIYQFDHESQLDGLVCLIMSQIGNNVGIRVSQEGLAPIEETEKPYKGTNAMRIAIEEIHKVADAIEETLKRHQADQKAEQ
jgi:hypothetical protein